MRNTLMLALLLTFAMPLLAADPPQPATRPAKLLKTLPGLTIDLTNRRVIAEAAVCQRDVMLEFAACSPDTNKEHESLLLVSAQPKHLHLALLLAGLRPGTPVRWKGEEFFPPTGDRVKITLEWHDPELGVGEIISIYGMYPTSGEKEVRKAVKEVGGRVILSGGDLKRLSTEAGIDAKLLKDLKQAAKAWAARRATDLKAYQAPLYKWIRSTKTKKPMKKIHWIFAGSRTMGDGTYWADTDGTIITVSNFESAVLDVPMRSTTENAELMWEANTKVVPRIGTAVKVIITAADPPAPKQITIHVNKDGTMAIKDKPVTAGQLEKILAKLTPLDRRYTRVVISASPQTPFKHVISVLDLLSEAKMPRINFSPLREKP